MILHDIYLNWDYFFDYQDRYDIEHFFRFRKRNLLMDKYQSPDTKHVEDWWKLVALAYQQLFLSRTEAVLTPKQWEKYLVEFKKEEEPLLSPSQTQRSFSKIVDKIGTGALPPVPRGNPKGREKGALQIKRQSKEIVIKKKKEKKKLGKKEKDSIKSLFRDG